jgi:hypothetical protein
MTEVVGGVVEVVVITSEVVDGDVVGVLDALEQAAATSERVTIRMWCLRMGSQVVPGRHDTAAAAGVVQTRSAAVHTACG